MGAPLQTGEAGRAHGAPRSGPPRRRPRRPENRPARTAPLRAAQAAAQGSHMDLSGAAAACPQRSPVSVLITRTLGTVPGFRDPDWQAWWILLSDTQKPWVSCHNATNFR